MTRPLAGSAGVRAIAWIAGAVAVAVALPPGVARGEDDEVREEVVDGPRENKYFNEVDLGALFDSQMAAGLNVGGPGDEAGPQGLAAHLRLVGAGRIARMDRACDLNDEQLRKLQLAIESDIRRCVAEIGETRSRYLGVKTTLQPDKQAQQLWGRANQEAQRCKRLWKRVFDEDSLFTESLATVLDERQRSIFTADLTDRRSFRWQALVTRAMFILDDMLALTQEQHDEVERMLLEKEPPLRLDGSPGYNNEQVEQFLVFKVLAEVDQAALEAAVGADRYEQLAMLANQGRSMGSLIQREGLLEPARK